MQYPLNLTFKVLALAQQASITDANGDLVFYVKQKLLKLKEEVTVFADVEQTRPLYMIKADRILDISALYTITGVNGVPLGGVKRQGLRSFWKAHYDIIEGEVPIMTIREESAWVKVLNALFEEIPFLGFLSGYVFHPAYLVSQSDGLMVMRLQKQPAFLESKFTIENRGLLGGSKETLALLSLLMVVLLERSRG